MTVELDARQATYWNNLGLSLCAQGHYADAVMSFEEALSLDSECVDAQHNLGSACLTLGQLERAAAAFQRVLTLRPGTPEALNNLGIVARRSGNPEAALGWFQRALDVRPDFEEAEYNRGTTLNSLGRADEAVVALERAVTLCPAHLDAYLNLSNALLSLGKLQSAQDALEYILRRAPAHPSAQLNLGNVLRRQGREAEAETQFRGLLSRDPSDAEALNNLGNLLLARNTDADQAIAHLRRAVKLRPASPDTCTNLGLALASQLELSEAGGYFEMALAVDPQHAHARWSRSLMLLLQGDLERGLADYEWRWQSGEMEAPRRVTAPAWTGEALNGRRVLLWAEQGLGDTLQFARYARLLAHSGASVVFEVQPTLERLMRESLPEVHVVAQGSTSPIHEVQTPLLSVPHLVDTRLATIPADVPYLTAEPERVAAWAERLGPRDGRQRIGLVWSGNPTHKNDRRRSLDATLLAPLAEVRGVEWHSLQRDPVSHPPLEMIDRTAALTDFAETAALLMHLDLVLTVDTAVAHLAGALGRPVWILLPYAAEWRWLLDRTDSPWYPTARLFRQPAPGDWAAVIANVGAELSS